ncbi:MAG: hypothetical protein MJ126_11135, partial [Lachnospiraceae bacterium]|nr:hypothetical protein [Lachnospiraceae bacterium]
MEEKELYFIYKDKDDYAQFMSLLESYNVSDNEKTLNLKLVNYPDTLYLSDGLKANQKALFVGEIGDSSSSKKNVEYVFSKYGVRYGWSGPNRAYIDIDDKLVKDKRVYEAFIEEFTQLPVMYARTEDATQRNKLGRFFKTFIVPMGFIRTIAEVNMDAAAVRKQLRAYALIMFFNNHLQEFLMKN